MEEHELLVVKWVNDLLGGRFVVPPHVVMETIVLIGLIAFFAILRTRYSVESPGRLQQAFELHRKHLPCFRDHVVEGRCTHRPSGKIRKRCGVSGFTVSFHYRDKNRHSTTRHWVSKLNESLCSISLCKPLSSAGSKRFRQRCWLAEPNEQSG